MGKENPFESIFIRPFSISGTNPLKIGFFSSNSLYFSEIEMNY